MVYGRSIYTYYVLKSNLELGVHHLVFIST
jgi:hypothetical protein